MLRRHSGLINYTILNYLDKALSFAVPLVVLWIFADKEIYNEIEYVFSVAAILAVVIELGVRNYFLYAYKESTDRDGLVAEVRAGFLFQFAVYFALGLVTLAVSYAVGGSLNPIYFFIVIRALFMYFVSFFTIYYRLIDRPSAVFGFSIATNVITIAIVLGCRLFADEINLGYFFVGQTILACGVFVAAFKFRGQIQVRLFARYLKQAIVFAWPIILNVFLFMFIYNYGRVYARNFLSEEQMFHISFVQRIALIIQLAHQSGVGYLSKRVFIDERPHVDRRVFVLYSGMMGLAVVGVFACLLGMNWIGLKNSVGIDLVTLLIVSYTVMWCYVAFFEMYINKMNKNRYILLFSGVASVVFIGALNLFNGGTLVGISAAMTGSMAVNLGLVIGYLLRKERVRHAAQVAADSYQYSATQ